jgi:ribosome-associated protein
MTEPEESLPLSKTKKKKLAKEVEALAHSLVEMPQQQFKKLQLPDDLVAEVVEARNTLGRGSHKRQVKHLAGILRQSEEQVLALISAIEDVDQVKRSEKRQFHKLEDLRDRLCDEKTFAEAFDEMIGLWPGIERGVISRLARSVHTNRDKRAYREIFKRLRDLVEQQD